MRKTDIETHYDRGSTYPAINVKHHLWLPDLFRKFEGVQKRSPHFCRKCGQQESWHTWHEGPINGACERFRRGGLYHVHEYGDDAGFWAWLHDIYDSSDWEAVSYADEWAAEGCWEQAREAASEIWGQHSGVKVWQMGRSGGWCCVDGLPDIETWDAIDVARWARFKRIVDMLARDEYPYQYVWHLAVNVWEPLRDERRNLYPAPNYAGAAA